MAGASIQPNESTRYLKQHQLSSKSIERCDSQWYEDSGLAANAGILV
jgi:hypothetical protein